jgi:hypothetical protein
LEEAFERAGLDTQDPFFMDYADASDYIKSRAEHVGEPGEGCNVWPETPGSSDTGSGYDHAVKPKGVPAWSRMPASDAEKALYYGVHIHSESNPLGLHTHVPGGQMSGGHSHGPQNRLGVHTHTESGSLDGKHVHKHNHPDGGHSHMPENFG